MCTSAQATGRSDRAGLEREPAVLGLECLGELLQVALEDPVELVHGQLDPVIGEPVLGEVVRPDLLGALAASDLRLALRGERGLLALALELVEARAQDTQRLRLVLELGLLV